VLASFHGRQSQRKTQSQDSEDAKNPAARGKMDVTKENVEESLIFHGKNHGKNHDFLEICP